MLKRNSILHDAKHKLSQVRLIVEVVWNHAYAKSAFTSLDVRAHEFFAKIYVNVYQMICLTTIFH